MSFRPRVNETITISQTYYQFTEHPSAPKMVYGQTGRRATIYQVLAQDGSLHALKVFTKAWCDPHNAASAIRLRAFADLPGLQVCKRDVFTPNSHAELIAAYPDLEYAVLMVWVSGQTWQEVMLSGQPLTVVQSRELGLAFLAILEKMERGGLAHCDLSGPNVLIHLSPVQVALVDVEDMYGPGLVRPAKVGAGSSGYGHKTVSGGLWSAEADRFAGAILLAEMLGWSDESVRRIGYGEQYFDPAEVQQSSERFQVLFGVLRRQWGSDVADAFARAWFSERLEDCPSFREWERLLNPPEPVGDQPVPEYLAQGKIRSAEELLGSDQIEQAVLELEEAYQMAPEVAASTYARALLMRGTARERQNNMQGALEDYQKALLVSPEGGLREELILIIADMEPKAEINEAVPDVQSAPVIALPTAVPVMRSVTEVAGDASEKTIESTHAPAALPVETSYTQLNPVENTIIPTRSQNPGQRKHGLPGWALGAIILISVIAAKGMYDAAGNNRSSLSSSQIAYPEVTQIPSETKAPTAIPKVYLPTKAPITILEATKSADTPAVVPEAVRTIDGTLVFEGPVEVSSRVMWVSTQMDVLAGDRVVIEYITGEWSVDPNNFEMTDGDGYPGNTPEQFCNWCTAPKMSGTLGQLVAKIIGSRTVITIGNQGDFVAEVDGTLCLMINDLYESFEDDKGSITVQVSIYR